MSLIHAGAGSARRISQCLVPNLPRSLTRAFAHSPSPPYTQGNFYAGQSVHDPVSDRQVLFGWVSEEYGEENAPNATEVGWASMISFPRTITVDPMNSSRALFYPIKEIETLWEESPGVRVSGAVQPHGGLLDVNGGGGVQLDIAANFSLPPRGTGGWAVPGGAGEGARVAAAGGADGAIVFGVNVFASSTNVSAKTAITVTINNGGDNETMMRAEVRISHTHNARAVFDIAPGETQIELRVLIDRSIVEVFAMGGRAVVTKRVYPTLGCSGVQLFNSGDAAVEAAAEVHRVMTAIPLSADELIPGR